MRRTIREQEPERPSTRLSTMLERDLTRPWPNTARPSRPNLVHLIRGDLDWIVMKALEKDRTRRYETANGLAMDIQRHLNNEPVMARPPSNLYRFQKLVRRNKLAFLPRAPWPRRSSLGWDFRPGCLLERRKPISKPWLPNANKSACVRRPNGPKSRSPAASTSGATPSHSRRRRWAIGASALCLRHEHCVSGVGKR